MTQKHHTLILKPGKDKSLRRHHPWIFSGAIAKVDGGPSSGETVKVVSDAGEFLAWAAYSPKSQIRARVWSFNEPDQINAAFFGERIHRAINRREGLATRSNAIRLIHGEADGLPGLICDRFEDTLVVQILSAGTEFHRDTLLAELKDHTGVEKMYERSDVDSRQLEGLPLRTGVLASPAGDGNWFSQPVHVIENGIHYEADVAAGHKTGFYVDQRENRALVKKLAQGRVLNCFSYTGGFSLAALKAGCDHVISIDSSGPAMEQAKRHAIINDLVRHQTQWIEGDVFKELRRLRAEEQTFDMIILDPPKFAPTAASVEKAARAYKDINLLGCQLLNKGGHLLTFSCSGAVTTDLFRKIVAGAAADAKADMIVRGQLGAGLDHPVLLAFPEGEYLKGLHLQKL